MRTIEQVFKYHAPKGDQVQRYTDIREAAKDFALLLLSKVPESHETDFAMQKLKECVMWANASIAINESECECGKCDLAKENLPEENLRGEPCQ